MNEEKEKKVFISYSWSSKEHEQWVIDLATDLEEAGVHVILDKWDLKEGADKYQFMEKMVTDKDVDKVVAVCDKVYSEKADGRLGGVGTESQIISQELYNQLDATDQKQKFVAIVTEVDENNKPYLPTFFKSRIYFEFIKQEDYPESFEKMLRWIFDKPLYKRPERGKSPTFLDNDEHIHLGTTFRYKLAMNALLKNKEQSIGYCNDYFDYFAENIERLRIDIEKEGELDEKIIQGITDLLPYRDEIVDLVLRIARDYSDQDFYDCIHKFLEKIIPYAYRPREVQSFQRGSVDHIKFFLNEIFLYVVSALLKNDRFQQINYLLEQRYFVESGSLDIAGGIYPFTIFRQHLESLEHRNKRLNLRRLSLMADLIEQRAKRKDISFNDIMQADFILFIRSELNDNIDHTYWWYPYTLVYSSNRPSKFEKFYRSESIQYFDKFKIVLGIKSIEELKQLMNDFNERKREVPRWQGESFSPSRLSNIEKLSSF